MNARLSLSKRVRELRKKAGYTQDKLSELTGIDYKYIQKIEGRNPPNLKIETVERLAKAFHLSLSKFLDFK